MSFLKLSPAARSSFLWPILALSLTACGPPKPDPEPQIDPDIARAELMLEQQDYLGAAQLYRELAARHTDNTGNAFLLSAAEASLKGGDLNTSQLLLDQAAQRALSPARQIWLRLLQAELLMKQRAADQALSLLLQTVVDQAPVTLQRQYFRDLADAYRLVGNLLESANALQALDARLDDTDERLKVQTEILRSLAVLNELVLSSLQPPPPSVAGGWMQLALLLKRHGDDREAMAPALEQWRQTYPNHPALPGLFESYQERIESQIDHAAHIAVLLPQSGRYARPAAALRDGILASLYQQPAERRPKLRFYDSSDSANAWPLYSQAVADGAEMVIGPLQKEALKQFARAGELPVPVLALNQVATDSIPPNNLFMFALSPEDEARAAAERIWQDGLHAPLLLVPDNNWGQRIGRAFDSRWQSLGGESVEQRRYDPSSPDQSAAITSLLHLDKSKARLRQMQQWLGRKLEFEPRRRADVDAFFIAARPNNSQSMLPQLQFHRAGDLPVYTTSQAWTGKLNSQQLADMRGLILSDIPLFTETERRAELARSLPGINGPLVRLYAMGMDAVSLLPHLRRLQSSSFESLDGETGNLFMDPENHILRQMVWLKLDQPPQILGYAPRLDLGTTSSEQTPPPPEALPAAAADSPPPPQ